VTRFIAATIDALVAGAMLVTGYAVFAALAFLVDPRSFRFPEASLLLSLNAAFVLLVVYLSVSWAATGRTYGCHVMGLRVVDHRGRRPRPLTALLRALLYAVFPIGLLWCAVSGANRSVQDILLRTSVVYDWQPRAARAAAPPA